MHVYFPVATKTHWQALSGKQSFVKLCFGWGGSFLIVYRNNTGKHQELLVNVDALYCPIAVAPSVHRLDSSSWRS